MKTAIIQIGNSDDKLTQKEWSEFCSELHHSISGNQIHFHGFSSGHESWQNGCWVFSTTEIAIEALRKHVLPSLCKEFKQDSIALTIGDTEFIK